MIFFIESSIYPCRHVKYSILVPVHSASHGTQYYVYIYISTIISPHSVLILYEANVCEEPNHTFQLRISGYSFGHVNNYIYNINTFVMANKKFLIIICIILIFTSWILIGALRSPPTS